jgi:glycogen(starch) synthase
MSTSDLLFSIVVNTTDRAASLRTLLRALDHQSYPHFEVIAVVGPTKDDTLAMLEEFGGRVRVLRCSRANLSVSRNIGLVAACGDIVAFIDDDAVPSRNWLRQLRRIFADPAIAGSGGSVYVVHPNQPVIQHRLGVASALAEQIDVRRSLLADMPLTGDGRLWTLRMMGTNMAYRRAALLDIGGFDEFYEWVYDDTDVAMRLAAAGKLLQPVADAVVYHVPASSRNRVAYSYLGRWWIQTKAATYFAHKNGRAAGVPPQVINERNLHLVHGHWTWTGQLRREGRINWRQMTNMRWNELKSSAHGYTAGTWGRRLFADTTLEPSDERRFQPFQTPASPLAPAVDPVSGRQPAVTMPDPPLRVALLSFNYPPEQQEGVGRHTNLMARGLFELGHTVHVLTHSAQESISFYDGAYVHRVPYHLDRYQNLRHLPKVHHRLNYSHAVHERLLRLILNDDIQLADTPVWQSDGFVTARAGALPVVVRPQTAVRQVAALEQQHDADTRLIAEIEEELLRRATAIAPNSQATVRALHEYYGIAAPPGGFTVIPHGIEPAPEEAVRPFPLTGSPAARTLLYVGRLERRKGILDLFRGDSGGAQGAAGGPLHRRRRGQQRRRRLSAQDRPELSGLFCPPASATGGSRRIPGPRDRRAVAGTLPKLRPLRGAVALRIFRPDLSGGDELRQAGDRLSRGRHPRGDRRWRERAARGPGGAGTTGCGDPASGRLAPTPARIRPGRAPAAAGSLHPCGHGAAVRRALPPSARHLPFNRRTASMTRPVTVDDLLNSVDFELLQGVLPQDELGQGIARLRSYQNEQRSALFGAGNPAPALDEVADLQLRLNEAMLTLIQVLGARFDGLAEQVRRAEYLQLRLDESAVLPSAPDYTAREAGHAAPLAANLLDRASAAASAPAGLESQERAIRDCMRAGRLDPWIDARPVGVPLIGGLLTRLRRSLHELVVFYVKRLAVEQAAVNQTYGSALLALEQAVRVQDALLRQAVEAEDSTQNA